MQEAVNSVLNMLGFFSSVDNLKCEAASLESRMKNKYLKMGIIGDLDFP